MVGRSRVATISGSSAVGEGFSFESYNSPYVAHSGSQVDTLLYHQYHFNGSDAIPISTQSIKQPSSQKISPTNRVHPLGRSPSYERAILSSMKNPTRPQKHSRGSSFPQFSMADSNFKIRNGSCKQKSSRQPMRTESCSSSCHPESVTSVTSLSSLDSASGFDQQQRGSSVRSRISKTAESSPSSQDESKKSRRSSVLSPDALSRDCVPASPTSSLLETSLPPYSCVSPQDDAASLLVTVPVHSNSSVRSHDYSNGPKNSIVHFSNATQTIISIPSFTFVELDDNRGN